jgi:hypothetical protein
MAPNRWGGAEYSWAADFNGDGRADIASASGRDIFVQISHERLREEPIVEAMLQALRQIDANVLSNDTLAEEVFGSFNVSRLNALREMIESNSQGLHDWFPEVVFFDPSRSSISDYDGSASFFDVASARFVEAPTLSGTYKDETVFLSEDFLGLNDQLLPTARCVFVQELAHHIDHYFGHESLGAEGLLVALEVCGGGADLDATELAALRERDDRADIELQTGSGYLSISGAELGLWKNIGIGVGITAAIVVIAIAPEALPFLAEAAEAVEATGASVEAAEAAEAALEAQTDVVALVGEGEEGVELAETAAEAADMALFEDPFAEGALEHVTEGEIGVQPQDLGRLRGGLHFERGLTSFISNYENVVGEVVEYVAQPCTNADFEAQVAEIFYDSTEYAESGNTINGLEWPNGVRIRQFGNELITGREARNATLRVGGQAFKGVKSFFPESWTEDMITQLGRMIARAADGGWADGDNTMGRYNPSSSGSWSYLQPSVNPHVWGFACGLVGAKICIIAGAANALGTQKSRRGTYWAETTRLTPIVLNFLGLRGIAASAYRGTRLSGRRRHWRRDSSVRCL